MRYLHTKLIASSTIFLFSFPLLATAYFGQIDTFFKNIGGFINIILIPLIFTVALLFFIWGMFLYFIKGGASDGEREKGSKLMIYAVVGFVLMVSIWGIVNLVAGGLLASFGNVGNSAPNLPGIPKP